MKLSDDYIEKQRELHRKPRTTMHDFHKSFFKDTIKTNWYWILLAIVINLAVLYLAVMVVKAAWD